MTRWDFELVIEARDLMDDEVLNALWHASAESNDDISSRRSNGVQYAGFMREAERLEEAVLSGIEQVERIGGFIVADVIDDSFVTRDQIAKRARLNDDATLALIDGSDGPGGFPRALDDPETGQSEWRWTDVVEWFRTSIGSEIHDPNGPTFAALTSVLVARRLCADMNLKLRSAFGGLNANGDPSLQPTQSPAELGLMRDECEPVPFAATD